MCVAVIKEQNSRHDPRFSCIIFLCLGIATLVHTESPAAEQENEGKQNDFNEQCVFSASTFVQLAISFTLLPQELPPRQAHIRAHQE